MIGTPVIPGQPLKILAADYNAVRNLDTPKTGPGSYRFADGVPFVPDVDVVALQPLTLIEPNNPGNFEEGILSSLQARKAEPGEPWGIAQKATKADTIGRMRFDGNYIGHVTPAAAVAGAQVGPVTDEVHLDAGSGATVLWASEDADGSGNHPALLRLGSGSAPAGIMVTIGSPGLKENGQEGLYAFEQSRWADPLASALSARSTGVPNGIRGTLNGTGETLPLIERNRYGGLEIGYIGIAFQEETDAGPRWFLHAARGLPGGGGFGQVVRKQADGSAAWDWPGAH